MNMGKPKKKIILKCPQCNSTRVHKTETMFKCDKCGFINDKTNDIIITGTWNI